MSNTKHTLEANAKLIAAAPDMLKALERIASWDSYKEHPIGITAREAIKKATE